MNDLAWLAVVVLLIAAALPVAVWFGIQIGQERARDEW